MNDSELKRFEAKITKAGDCWLWANGELANGYGQVTVSGAVVGAHRASYEHFVGSVPAGLVVRHTCDTPACVNPKHLIAGTKAQNSLDMTSRNRQAFGSKHGSAKVNESQVLEIRRVHVPQNASFGAAALARKYGVSEWTIRAIVQGKTWSCV